MTRKPARPIKEQGVLHVQPKLSWFDKMNPNGDFGIMILCAVLAPVALPYFWLRSLWKNT